MTWSGTRNLVICRAGDNSLHPHWLKPPGEKRFDLWVDYYGGTKPGKYTHTCDLYRESGGVKYPEIYKFIKENIYRVLRYDAVWFPDDDILCNAITINRMFEIFHRYQLRLAQPSLSRNSMYSHEITLNQPENVLRYTDYVEPMAPIFSRVALQMCLATFPECMSGWGLDYVWPKLLGSPKDKIGIIDAVTVHHTRQVGAGELYRGLIKSPQEEMGYLAKKYQFVPFVMTTYCAIHH